MTRCEVDSEEAYSAYLSGQQVDELYQFNSDQCRPLPPPPQFYTTRSGLTCRRYYCQVCGPLARTNLKTGPACIKYIGKLQRQMDWISGTTLPDALTRSREAMLHHSH
uniref:Uncharacterized protein n=1 Tax=Trichobilharzia regenti TaxID=157069 RepID=A0AA85IT04_TRIRE|nr:unnamed protein product [Trichobilharzia regenti]